MRRSNSRFKRSSLSNSISIKTVTNAISLPLAVAVLFVSNCRSRPATDEAAAAMNTPALVEIKDDVKPSWIPLRDGPMGSGNIVAWLGAKSCIEPHVSIKSRIVTALSGTDIRMEQAWDGAVSTVIIDATGMSVPVTFMEPSLKESICAAVQGGTMPVALPVEVADRLKSGVERVIAAVAPDCVNVEVHPEGWSCSLTTLMPQAAIIKIEEFQQAMIRRWSRQPYILARRAGVTMALARLATNLTAEEGVHKFCKMLQFSLPEELPLVMTSSDWQKTLCDGAAKQRREVAMHGLAKAVEEIGMLRELYENTSKVGVFSVRIPDSDIPGRAPDGPQPLRVTITPEAEVTDRLIEVAESMLRQTPQETRRGRHMASAKVEPIVAEHRKPHCWHPVFGDSPSLLRVAEGMRLTGDGFKGVCNTSSVTPATHDALVKYLMQSLTSETEFVMDNGQSKLLRLPEGGYKYSVQVLPQNPIDAEEAVEENTPQTQGDISWGNARNHSIKVWQ